MKIKELSPNPKNPRKITDQKLKMLKSSYQKHGDLGGIVFNIRFNRLIGGHQTQKTLDPETQIIIEKRYEVPTKTGTVAEGYVDLDGEKIKYREVDVDELTEKAMNIAANKGAGDWDFPLLIEWFHELDAANFSLDDTMWGRDELEKIMTFPSDTPAPGCDEDEVPDGPKETITKPGDLWILGNHRLLCGDSTNIQHVERLMNGEKADVIFTDPPYNLQEHGQTKRTNKTESKTEKFGDWDEGFNPLDVLPILTSYTTDNAHQFVCTSSWLFGIIHKYFEDLKEKPNYLVWIKNNPMPSLSKSTFVQSTELIIHSRKGSPKFNYPSGKNLRNIIEGNVEPHTEGHPSQKPIYVIELCIEHTVGSVLDLFGGSGSTLIACEKTNRKCFMMELDPHYCDVIIARWEKFSGKRATLSSPDTLDTISS